MNKGYAAPQRHLGTDENDIDRTRSSPRLARVAPLLASYTHSARGSALLAQRQRSTENKRTAVPMEKKHRGRLGYKTNGEQGQIVALKSAPCAALRAPRSSRCRTGRQGPRSLRPRGRRNHRRLRLEGRG